MRMRDAMGALILTVLCGILVGTEVELKSWHRGVNAQNN